mmetsp:Transcript_21997/g.32769  ORF Transcript_21997/g.32769 Transcript_21997/m.32769 type:complete len:82 (+) Transcript_21997:208-453(+)
MISTTQTHERFSRQSANEEVLERGIQTTMARMFVCYSSPDRQLGSNRPDRPTRTIKLEKLARLSFDFLPTQTNKKSSLREL